MTNRPDDRKPWVFFNYRGKDTASSAACLETRLREAFGPSSVFLDHQSISLGHDFHPVIVDAVAHSAVLLAIIGDGWLDEDASGHRLIDDPDDWVRRELLAALDRNVLIIPMLIGDATPIRRSRSATRPDHPGAAAIRPHSPPPPSTGRPPPHRTPDR